MTDADTAADRVLLTADQRETAPAIVRLRRACLCHDLVVFPLLDDERLNGPHVATIDARPFRIAYPVDSVEAFRSIIELECQVWGGAASVLLPTDQAGMVPGAYRERLAGSQVDQVFGHHGDFHLTMKKPLKLDGKREFIREQLAAGLHPYRQTERQPAVEVVHLEVDDPWHDIYLACLGTLPGQIDERLIARGNWVPDLAWTDFLDLRRSTSAGSLEDLLARTWPSERQLTPRQVSMSFLSYGGTASASIRSKRVVLPDEQFAKYDAGPNVVVVCRPGSVEDLALLWNLRAAHGDHYALPIGIPLKELTADTITKIVHHPGSAVHGVSANSLYVTSASMTPEEIRAELGRDVGRVDIRGMEDMLTFGRVFGWSRDEALVWTEGQTRFKMLDRSSQRELLTDRNLNEFLAMHFDVRVGDAPLPAADDFRAAPGGGSFYAGARTTWSGISHADKFTDLEWPSRLLIAKSLAAHRGLELRESAPGVASRVMLERLGGVASVAMLCHGPLLGLLESMAVREGFSWYKARLRDRGIEADPMEAVAKATDELPDRSFHEFKRALGNNNAATRRWLQWAEEASVVIKGFPVQCPACDAKQWVPVNSFAPPLVCRGCTATILYPFGARATVDFKYRLAEPMRRVYEADAMGHLLAARFFHEVFFRPGGSDLIGLHPGMEVRKRGEQNALGEADVLLLTRRGDFIPVEVKRTATGLTAQEQEKLRILGAGLGSPWTVLAIGQYSMDAGEAFTGLATRRHDGAHLRMALSLDTLLQPHAFWSLSEDPFENAPLSTDEIDERQREFVKGVEASDGTPASWLEYSLLRPDE